MNEFKLYVTSGLAFFLTPTEVIRSNQITVTYQGEEPVDVVVNGKIHQMQNGAASVDINDLREGMNICEVCIGGETISCEGLIVRGGFVLPAGITDKAYVLNLCKTCVTLSERNAELEREVAELTKKTEAFTDDIFDLG
jgi:hypothetical protein